MDYDTNDEIVLEHSTLDFAVTWSAVLAYDIVVFLLIVHKGVREHWRDKSSLWNVLIWDGK
jgi:hypothetical protein